MNEFYLESLNEPALTVMKDVCGVKTGERVLIVTNPQKDVLSVSMALNDAATKLGAASTMIVQEEKTLIDFADKSVIAAIATKPDVVLSISANKLGKDEEAMKKPFIHNGAEYPHIFDYLLDGTKEIRSFWTPGMTVDMFVRTACIDYALLDERCQKLSKRFENAVSVSVTAPGGTDILVPVENRKPFSDDGKFDKAGTGGNIPAGEVFISPVVGGCEGVIVFDGSMSVTEGDIGIDEPIICTVKAGFVEEVYNKAGNPPAKDSEAGKLLSSILGAEAKADEMLEKGIFSAEKAASYKKNARNIGELGIGLNPSATISGNMLEDEKAFKTCHFAIGSNYDNDAESFIHLDGVVKNPTIVINYKDGSSFVVEKDGVLQDL